MISGSLEDLEVVPDGVGGMGFHDFSRKAPRKRLEVIPYTLKQAPPVGKGSPYWFWPRHGR